MSRSSSPTGSIPHPELTSQTPLNVELHRKLAANDQGDQILQVESQLEDDAIAMLANHKTVSSHGTLCSHC